MSSPEPVKDKKGVQINKHTGGAYVDIGEIIESELARIKEERERRSDSTVSDTDTLRDTERKNG